MWDTYGDWNEIANIPAIEQVKFRIAGDVNWQPNKISAKILEHVPHVDKTVLDFGCGLGRNALMLSGLFNTVLGYDIPSMLARYKEQKLRMYDNTFSDINLLKLCIIDVVYDSVCFQHLVDANYIRTLVSELNYIVSFKTLVSIYLEGLHPIVLDEFKRQGWHLAYKEQDSLSFNRPHIVEVLKRS